MSTSELTIRDIVVTPEDIELGMKQGLPDSLQPDNLEDTIAWWVKLFQWFAGALYVRGKELTAARLDAEDKASIARIAVANLEAAEAEVEKWKTRAINFGDTITAINVKVFGLDDPADPDAKEWPDGLLSDEVLALKNRAIAAEAKLAEIEAAKHKEVDYPQVQYPYHDPAVRIPYDGKGMYFTTEADIFISRIIEERNEWEKAAALSFGEFYNRVSGALDLLQPLDPGVGPNTFLNLVAKLVTRLQSAERDLADVDDVLVSNWVGPRVDGDYRLALHNLISFNQQIALDPAVSEEARTLIAKGASEARDKAFRDAAQIAEETPVLYCGKEIEDQRERRRAQAMVHAIRDRLLLQIPVTPVGEV